ncbi:hypothetical protein BDZ89DRAFT_489879 [Hymenopellis radicata]|nr:hypothetical protein BDZ89DRAFT_489879 [Hymenopellis radicata]
MVFQFELTGQTRRRQPQTRVFQLDRARRWQRRGILEYPPHSSTRCTCLTMHFLDSRVQCSQQAGFLFVYTSVNKMILDSREPRPLPTRFLAMLEVTQRGTSYVYQGHTWDWKSIRMSRRAIIGTTLFSGLSMCS